VTRSFARSAPWLLLLLNAAWLGPAIAADPESEASREVEFRFQLAPATRLFVTTSLSRNNFRSSKEISLALALDRKISPAWSYRVGIRQIGTSESEDRSLESRAVVDMTYQRALGAKWTLYNRNRADLRWVESKPFSYRLRDRLMLERSASVGRRDITWYASYEIYFDSRYDGLARDRGIIGISVPVTRIAAVEVYAARANQHRPDDRQTNAVGLLLTLTFGRPDAQSSPTAAPPVSE
jgi:hypothetical protein